MSEPQATAAEIETAANWCERIRIAMRPHRGQLLSTDRIIALTKQIYPGANDGNVLPGDHCYGRDVKAPCPHCQKPGRAIFEQIKVGHYRVVLAG